MNFETNFNHSRFQQYLDFLKASGTSSATIDRKVSSFNSFQAFLIKKGYIQNQPNSVSFPLSSKREFKGDIKNKSLLGRYLLFGTLIAIILGLGYGLYSQTILKAKKDLAYTTANNPIRAGRILSFQGRLTDSVGNPITSSTDILFKLYTSGSGGTELYTSSIGNSQTVTPDDNGIFSVVIGKSHGTEIPSSVFTENPEVWLEITAGSETMTPRQQIATVGYALNSETLQGLPPSASGLKDTVLVIDHQGNLNLGETSPTIKSTSGIMAIEGQALLLKASDGSGGNITINPDGSGSIRFLTEGTSPSSGGFIDLSNANIAGGNLINSQINNDNRGYNFLSFQNYNIGTTTLSTRFSVNSYGSAYFGAGITTPAITMSTGASNGYILQSDALGNASWVNATTAGIGTSYDVGAGLSRTGNIFSLNLGSTNTWLAPQYFSNNVGIMGNLGIGTTSPTSKLELAGTGSLFRIADSSNNTLVNISDTSAQFNLPTTFTSTGDVSLANNLNFTNTTSSYINSAAPLYLQAGESFNSSDLTLRTYNSGNVVIDSQKLNIGGTLTYSQGAATGYILQTDASGNASWVAPTGIGGTYTASNGITLTGNNFGLGGQLNQNTSIGTSSFTFTLGNNTSTPSIYVGTNGNVGIGTTNPTGNLEVHSNTTYGRIVVSGTNSGTATQADILLKADTYGRGTGIYTFNSGYSSTWYFGNPYNQENSFAINRKSGASFDESTAVSYGSGVTNLLFINSSNNVGIGTTAPSKKLDVTGDINLTGTIFTAGTSGTSGQILSSTGTGLSWIDPLSVGNTYGAGSGLTLASSIFKLGGALTEDTNLTIGNTSAFFINGTNGNVGIGTTGPGQRLSVASGSIAVYPRVGDTTSGFSLYRQNSTVNKSLTITTNSSDQAIFDNSSSDYLFNTAGATKLSIIAGNVGIGTTSGLAKLLVNGGYLGFNYNSSGNYPNYSGAVQGAFGWNFSNSQGEVDIWNSSSSGTPRGFIFKQQTGTTSAIDLLTIQGSGNVGIGTTNPTSILHVNKDISGSRTRIIIENIDQRLSLGSYFSAGVGQYSTIQATDEDDDSKTTLSLNPDGGSVGIGTTSPSKKLDVAGDINLTGTIFSNGTSGTSGQILSSTGTGLSWINASSVGATYVFNNGLTNYGSFIGLGGTLTQNTNFTIGNTSAFFINGTNGNVGIGTTNPTYKLQISGSNAGVYVNRTGGAEGFILVGTEGTGGQVRGLSGGGLRFTDLSDTNTEYIRFTSSGNVGIGTTSPTQKLDVVGAARISIGITTPNLQLTSVPLSTGTTALLIDASGNLTQRALGSMAFDSGIYDNYASWNLLTNGTGSTAITSNTNVNFVNGIGISLAQSGSTITVNNIGVGTTYAAGSGLTLSSNIFRLGGALTENMRLNIGNTEALFIQQSTGNVGIGTTNPLYSLHVVSSNANNPGLFVNASVSGLNPLTIIRKNASGDAIAFGSDNVMTGSTSDGLIFPYNSSSNVGGLAFYSTSGTTKTFRMGITSSGNVGIGTTNPIYNLQVYGNNATVGIGLSGREKTLKAGVLVSPFDPFTITSKGNTSGWRGTIDFNVSYNGGTEFTGMRLAANTDGTTAYLGIGTTSPIQKLDVVGAARISIGITTPNLQLTSVPLSTGTTALLIDASGNLTQRALGSMAFDSGIYDNYASWNLLTNGTGSTAITSNTNVNFVNGIGISLAQSGSTITVNNIGIGTTYSAYNGIHLTAQNQFGLGGTLSQNVNLTIGNTSAFFINATNGNVGIGTTNPGYKLQIGDTSSTFTAFNASDVIGGWTNNTRYQLSSNGTLTLGLPNGYDGGALALASGSATNGRTVISGAGSGQANLQFFVGSTVPSFTVLTSGNVGIGATNPGDKLTVGLYETPSFTLNQDKTVGIYGAGAAYFRGRDTSNDIEFMMGTSASGYPFVASITNHPLVFRVNNATEVMRLNSNSFVGIGTTAPTQKLDIVGAARVSVGITTPNLQLTSVPVGTGTTALFIDASGNLTQRSLGSMAFDSGTYDNYQSWNLLTNSTGSTAVTSNATVNFVNGVGISLVQSGSTITINNSGVGTTYAAGSGLTLASNVFSLGGTLTQNTNFTIGNTSAFFINGTNGNIGIGTTNTLGNLDVRGSTTAGNWIGLFAANGITPENSAIISGTGQNKALSVQGNGAAYFMGRDITNDIEFIMGTSTAGAAFAGSMTAHDFWLRTNNTTRMTILKDTGLVGINTQAPTYNLHVAGSIGTTSLVTTGNLTIGGTFVSVGSTNLVTNLNSDLLDGYHASAFVGIGATANFLTTLNEGIGISITGTGVGRTIALTNTAVTPGTYGSGTSIPTFTVDAQGRLTSAGSVALPAGTSYTASNGVTLVANDFQINHAYANTWTATQTFANVGIGATLSLTGLGTTISDTNLLLSLDASNNVRQINTSTWDKNTADDYSSWFLQSNSANTTSIGTGTTVNFVNGVGISLAQSGSTITINNTSVGTTYTAGVGLTLSSANVFSLNLGSTNVWLAPQIFNGGIGVTGNLAVGGTFISVGSTNLVTNLNANYLNGHSDTYFLDLGDTAAFIQSLTNGGAISITGTGIGRTLAIDYNTTNLRLTANQLNTIQNIDVSAQPTFARLGIGSTNSLYALNVGGTTFTNNLFTSGNVGIGTTSPLGNLNVVGAAGSGTRIIAQATGTETADFADFDFYNSDGNVVGAFRYVPVNGGNYGGSNSINFINVLSAPLTFGTNNTVRMTIDPSGNLSLTGAASIGSSLSIGTIPSISDNNLVLTSNSGVVSSLDTTNWDKSSADDLTSIAAGIGITISGSGSSRTIAFDGSQIGNMTFGSGSTFNWTFNAGATQAALTFKNGLLGLGTTDPRTTLEVNGTIASQKFVDLTGYDTFFIDLANSDYNSSSMQLDRRGSIKWNAQYTTAWTTIDNGFASKIESGLDGLLLATSVGTTTAGSTITNWNQNLFLAGTGNVGVGTTSPRSKFHISWANSGCGGQCYTDAAIFENSANVYLQLMGGTSNEKSINFGNPTNGADGAIKYNQAAVPNGFGFWANGNVFRMAIDQNGNVGIGGTSSGSRLHVFGDSIITGNVGIGTTSPRSKLDVLGALTIGGTQNVGIQMRTNLDLDRRIIFSLDSGTYAKGTFNGNPLTFEISGNEAARFSSTGYLGIGTTSPREKLQVNGSLLIGDTNFYPTSWPLRAMPTNAGGMIQIAPQDYQSGQIALIYTSSEQATSTLTLDPGYGPLLFLNGDSNSVGIGTTNPFSPFEVLKTTTGAADISRSGSTDATTISRFHFGVVGLDLGVINSGAAYIQNRNTSNFATTYPLLLQPGGGNVGIGTTNPLVKLYISAGALGTTNGNTMPVTTFNGTSSNAEYLNLFLDREGAGTDWQTATWKLQRKVDSSDMGYIGLGNANSNLITFGENTTEYMRISGNGKIGIGTTNPLSLLHIGTTTAMMTMGNGGTMSSMDLLSMLNSSGTYNDISTNAYWNGSNWYQRNPNSQSWLLSMPSRNDNTGAFDIIGKSTGMGSTASAITWDYLFKITPNGNVGIGYTTATPDNKLDVFYSGTSHVAHFKNGSTASTAPVLALQLGATTTSNNYITFLGPTSTAIGRVRPASATSVAYATTGTGDFAEYINGDEATEPGDIIAYHSQFAGKARPGQTLAGIYSTYGTFVAGENLVGSNPNAILLTMSGITQVKVNSSNGPINNGDPITLSSNSIGVGAKATSAGYIVAQAMESYSNSDPSQTGLIKAQVSLSYYDPDLFLTDTGEVNVNYNVSSEVLSSLGYVGAKNEIEAGTYTLTNSTGKIVTRISQFASLAAAKINTGLLTAKSIIVDNLAAKKIASETIITGDITATTATVSGTLTTDKFIANEATISTLYADNIISKDGSFQNIFAEKISSLREEIKNIIAQNSVESTPSALMADVSTWDTSVATDSANLDLANLTISDNLVVGAQLIVTGNTKLDSVSVQNTLTVGQIALNSNIIETTSADLYVQPSALATIHFLNDRLVLSPDGNVTINGNLNISGSLIANLLNVKDIQTETLTAEKINVATISALPNVAIADASTASATATSSATIATNATAGSVTLNTGSTEIIIENSRLTPNSMVYLTPNASTQNQVLYVKNKNNTSFTIAIDRALDHDVDINWWLIN